METGSEVFDFLNLIKAIFFVAFFDMARVVVLIIISRVWLPSVVVLSFVTISVVQIMFLLTSELRFVAAFVSPLIYRLFVTIVIMILLSLQLMTLMIFYDENWFLLMCFVEEELIVMVMPARLIVTNDMLVVFDTLNYFLKF